MFHEMGRMVAQFWSLVSFGVLHYDISRSQSIMRIATTASPISGGDVREMQKELIQTKNVSQLKHRIHRWLEQCKQNKEM